MLWNPFADQILHTNLLNLFLNTFPFHYLTWTLFVSPMGKCILIKVLLYNMNIKHNFSLPIMSLWFTLRSTNDLNRSLTNTHTSHLTALLLTTTVIVLVDKEDDDVLSWGRRKRVMERGRDMGWNGCYSLLDIKGQQDRKTWFYSKFCRHNSVLMGFCALKFLPTIWRFSLVFTYKL